MKTIVRRVFVVVIRILSALLTRVRVEGLAYIPLTGPAILVSNHINAVEPLLLYTLLPRHVTALAKVEIWSTPVFGLIAASLDAIPIHRGELDLDAMRQAIARLRAGGMLGVAPEGTRSHHGHLQRGLPGVVSLAQRVPHALIVPVAISGQEHLPANLLRLRRTPISVVFGQGFYLNSQDERVNREARQQMVDEIMMEIAKLLPPQNRGVYSDTIHASRRYLRYANGDCPGLPASHNVSIGQGPVGAEP